MYKCLYCHKVYEENKSKLKCQDSHLGDLVFLPLFREDLSRLWSYVLQGNPEVLTERLSRTIRKYAIGEKE